VRGQCDGIDLTGGWGAGLTRTRARRGPSNAGCCSRRARRARAAAGPPSRALDAGLPAAAATTAPSRRPAARPAAAPLPPLPGPAAAAALPRSEPLPASPASRAWGCVGARGAVKTGARAQVGVGSHGRTAGLAGARGRARGGRSLPRPAPLPPQTSARPCPATAPQLRAQGGTRALTLAAACGAAAPRPLEAFAAPAPLAPPPPATPLAPAWRGGLGGAGRSGGGGVAPTNSRRGDGRRPNAHARAAGPLERRLLQQARAPRARCCRTPLPHLGRGAPGGGGDDGALAAPGRAPGGGAAAAVAGARGGRGAAAAGALAGLDPLQCPPLRLRVGWRNGGYGLEIAGIASPPQPAPLHKPTRFSPRRLCLRRGLVSC
jgi:hypothetical protein